MKHVESFERKVKSIFGELISYEVCYEFKIYSYVSAVNGWDDAGWGPEIDIIRCWFYNSGMPAEPLDAEVEKILDKWLKVLGIQIQRIGNAKDSSSDLQ